MALTFEWDTDKADSNLEKHGVSFQEESTVFGDTFSVTIRDPLHSDEESRFVTVGESAERDVLVVIHTYI